MSVPPDEEIIEGCYSNLLAPPAAPISEEALLAMAKALGPPPPRMMDISRWMNVDEETVYRIPDLDGPGRDVLAVARPLPR